MQRIGNIDVHSLGSSCGISSASGGILSSFLPCGGANTKKTPYVNSENDKQETKFTEDVSSELDKNGDGKISSEEVNEYVSGNNTKNTTEQPKKNETTDTAEVPKDEAIQNNDASYQNEAAKANEISTTVSNYNPQVNYVPVLQELQSVPFQTELPAVDENLMSLGLGGNAGIKSLDSATKDVLDKFYKNKDILFCKDCFDDDGCVERKIRFENGEELVININSWGQADVKMKKYSGNPDKPQNNDTLEEQRYISLSDGVYAVHTESIGIWNDGWGENGSFASNLGTIEISYGNSDKRYYPFKLYDKNGNEITYENNRSDFEKYMDEAQKSYTSFRFI